jgi:hypothetical protein
MVPIFKKEEEYANWILINETFLKKKLGERRRATHY